MWKLPPARWVSRIKTARMSSPAKGMHSKYKDSEVWRAWEEASVAAAGWTGRRVLLRQRPCKRWISFPLGQWHALKDFKDGSDLIWLAFKNLSVPGRESPGVAVRVSLRLPCPPPGIFPTQGSNPGLPHCRQIFLLSEPPGKLCLARSYVKFYLYIT